MEAGRLPHVVEPLIVLVAQIGELLRRRRPAQAATADAAEAEARRLLAGEHEQFDRSPWPKTAACKARIASRPPSTPTVPSYVPEWGIASVCEPVPTAGRFGSVPIQRANRLPIGSSRTARPASVQSRLRNARACRSAVGVEHAGDGRRLGVAEASPVRPARESAGRCPPCDVGHASAPSGSRLTSL